MFRQRNHIFLNLTQLRRYGDLTVTTFDLTESYLSVDLRYDSRVRRVTSLEQLGYTRKTTGDITGLTYGTRDLNQNLTSFHYITIVFHDVSTQRQRVVLQVITILIHDMSGRSLRLILRLDDDLLLQTGSLITLNLVSYVLYQTLELDLTGNL